MPQVTPNVYVITYNGLLLTVFPVQMRNLCKIFGLPCRLLERRVCSRGRPRHMRILNLSSTWRKSKRVQGTKNVVRHYMRSNTRQERLLVSSYWETSSILQNVLTENTVEAVLCCRPLLKLIDWRVLERYKIILQMKFSSLI